VLKAPTAALLSIIFQGGWFKSGTSRTQVERLYYCAQPALPEYLDWNIRKAYKVKNTRMQRTQETGQNQEAKITKWYQSVAKSSHNLSLNKRMSMHSAPKHVVGIPENSLLQLWRLSANRSLLQQCLLQRALSKIQFSSILLTQSFLIAFLFFSLDCSKDQLIPW